VADPPKLPAPLSLAPALFPEGVVVRAIELFEPSEAALASFSSVALPERLATAALERKIHYLAGRSCARDAMGELSPPHRDVPVPTGESREPLFPEGIVGTVSHTKRYAAAAVAHASRFRGLGVDVERWMKIDAPPRLAGHVTVPGELTHLLETTGFLPHEALTLVFSAKESVYKAFFGAVRRYFGFHDARITRVEERSGAFFGQLESHLTGELSRGYTFEGRYERVDGGLVTAVAFPSRG